MALSVATGSGFSFGETTTLFSVSVTTASADFAVSDGGQRFLTNELPPTSQSKIGARLIQNWLAVIER